MIGWKLISNYFIWPKLKKIFLEYNILEGNMLTSKSNDWKVEQYCNIMALMFYISNYTKTLENIVGCGSDKVVWVSIFHLHCLDGIIEM